MNARDAFLANELRGLARAFQRIAEKPNVSEVLRDSPRVAEAGDLLRTAYSRGLIPELGELSELVTYIESSTDQSEITARDEVLFQLFCGLRGFVESEFERKAPYCPESLNYVFRLTGISDAEPDQINWEEISEWEVDQFSVVCNWLADMIEQRSQSTIESPKTPEQTSIESGLVEPREPEKPRWDRAKGTLYLGETVIRKVRVKRAENLVPILDAFQEEHWPTRIDDPLPPKEDSDSRKRREDARDTLNKGLHRLRFHVQGEGFTWEVV